MGYHRHAGTFLTFAEGVELMAKHGPDWRTAGPFAYCPICKRVPDTFIAEDPSPAAPAPAPER